MLLTLSNPVKSDFEFKPHAYSPALSSSTVARYSPKLESRPSLAQTAVSSYRMGTPHRGLPPPSAMTLPEPGRGPPLSSGLGQLPPAPSQWQGAEDGMKNWLAAKAEEERRKQEEERTRQESLRLEQRKVEQAMLRESMQGGIPPHLVPIIFAGIGGGNLANMSAEWIQQYTAQVQAAQQQTQIQAQTQHSPDLRRDPRTVSQQQAAIYAGQSQTPQTILAPTAVLSGQPLSAQSQHTSPGYSDSRASQSTSFGGQPTSVLRHPPQSQLPRLTTNEMNIQQPPAAPSGVQQLQQTQNAQQEQSSPSIYFHHWVPPTASSQQEKSGSGHPPTPSGKYKTSPTYQSRQRATSHASDLEYASSPKKRKAQGPHQPAPPPTSAAQYTSPSFSHISSSSASTPGRRGHARGRSDASQRGPESAGGSLSRRSTVSGLVHETLPRQEKHAEESRAPEGKARADVDQTYATSPRGLDERSQGLQNYAPTSTGKPETSGYGSHQHWDRGQMSSPKREVGDR
ncbi:hypothetical protein IAQ61_004817 [Plenodomus lingam]|uniref:Uncharacterized protein n=1 Tax=Leptosphaeria maculans (strain JN3 / isolate v23.1.3 / race Av1-4-5-6-7-8) TaxID=985895 RepID=E4ZWL9_LEPMJ|nr:hypothetical protein LEMA_P031470.1 [Plenodomus lingam JN3]KAH9874188.1 hypothetical protein IAQ61_004817 [Plenodomus lingam]CBX95995.1 hypothetical protein LEMA_P031470.1 [Plenodomus lingam JN3]